MVRRGTFQVSLHMPNALYMRINHICSPCCSSWLLLDCYGINSFLHSGNINALDHNTVQNQQAVTKTGAWVTINQVHSISTLSWLDQQKTGHLV
jgi:hypothetical protein